MFSFFRKQKSRDASTSAPAASDGASEAGVAAAGGGKESAGSGGGGGSKKDHHLHHQQHTPPSQAPASSPTVVASVSSSVTSPTSSSPPSLSASGGGKGSSVIGGVIAQRSPPQSRKLAELEEQLENQKRNLVSQEARYQEKLTELSGQLAAREAEANRLHLEIEDLKRELVAKASGMDRLQAELAASNKEGEYVKQTLRKLEEDVTGFRHKNTELADELQMKAGEIEALMEEKIKLEEEMKRKEEEKEEESSDEEEEDEEDKEERRRKEEEANKKVEELERRVRELEGRVTDLSGERERLREEKRRLVAEREEEMRIVQEALDGAIEEKASIQARFERDFETLRTVNTDREQQLLDDFEWKLREVEATCKRRLEERDRTAEERLKAVKEEAEAQLAATKKDLAAAATHEAELAQLRSLSHEQQRSLRAGARQIESLQVSEKILQEEASKLRKLYEREKAHLDSAQANHDKKLADTEKTWRNRLEALRNELNSSWEQRLKKDLARLRTELEAAQQMEKLKLEEEASIKFRAEKRELEKKLKAASDELEQLKASLESKESSWRRDIEKVQANSDRDILDLRRKLDKLDMSYQDKIENMTAQHQKELDKLNEEADQRMAAAEQNWQMQLSSTRTTLELVKEQMERDACKRMEALQDEYQAKLDAQWKRLNEEKEKAVITVEMKFLQQLGILKEEMEKSSSNANAQESEHLHKIINSLKEELSCQTKVIDDLQGNVDTLQGGVQVLNEELNSQSREMEKFQSEAETILRERESQLEAQRLSELEEVRNAHAEEASKWQKEAQTMRDNFQKKAASLCAMLEEWRRKYEARGPRPQDMQTIADLQQALDERERDLSALTEEKRFYQLELAKRKKESFFDSQNSFESTEPVARPRRKGSKLEAGNHNERGADVSSNVGIRGADRGRGSSVGSNTDTLPRQPTGRNSSIQPTVRVRRRDSSPNMSRATQRDETRSSAATPDDHSSSSTTRTRSRSVDLDMIVHPTAAPRTSLPPKNVYVRCSNVRVTPEIRTVPTPPPPSSTDIAPPSTLPICRSPSPTSVISIQVDSSPEKQPDATDSCHSHSPSPPTLISLLTPTHTPTPTPSQFESSNPRPDSSGNDFFDAPLFISEPNLSDNPTPQPDSSGSDFYDAPLYITEPNDSESSPKPVQTTSSHQNVCNSPVPTASAIFDPQPETPAHHPDFPSPPSSPTNLSYREDGLVVVSGSLGLEIAPSTSNSLNPPVPAPPDPTPPK